MTAEEINDIRMKLTNKELRALKIVSECPSKIGIMPKDFGAEYFSTPEHKHLLTSVSNIGHGAAAGVKAWRLSGCILGKLARKDYVRKLWGHYHLTEKGIIAIKQHGNTYQS